MAIDVTKAGDNGEHGEFTSDRSGQETFWEGAGSDVPSFSLPCPGRYQRDNGETYFNSSGLAGNWVLENTGGVATDHHSGIDCIEVGETVTIEPKKQMIVYGRFKRQGTLIKKGKLIRRRG